MATTREAIGREEMGPERSKSESAEDGDGDEDENEDEEDGEDLNSGSSAGSCGLLGPRVPSKAPGMCIESIDSRVGCCEAVLQPSPSASEEVTCWLSVSSSYELRIQPASKAHMLYS